MTAQFEWELSNASTDLNRFIDDFSLVLKNQNLSSDNINHLCLILDEIITNIMTYGFNDNKPHHIHIEANLGSGTIETIIKDDGIPFDPTKQTKPDVSLPLEDRPIGGLGLYLVKSFVDSIDYQYENGHNVLSLVKKLRAAKDKTMEITTIIKDMIAILKPQGRIDSVTANEFDTKITELLDKGQIKVIIDFSHTDFISSAGLRILLLKAKLAKSLKGKIVLSNMSESIAEVFEVSGFSTLFTIYKTVDAAEKGLL